MEKGELNNFTEGKILMPLMRFAMPVLLALFLQAMYGAVDLLVVGQYATAADISAVSTGSEIMFSATNLVSSFAMGATVLLGQQIGERRAHEGGRTVGTCILLFACIAAAMTLFLTLGADTFCTVMQAPPAAHSRTVEYVSICGGGMIVIVAYNLIGSVFRGIGDSTTPLITVAIACVCNIVGDLLLVAVFGKGAAGAAIATVFAQMVSVISSYILIRRKKLPFSLEKSDIRFDRKIIARVSRIGIPIALQEFLVGISFLVIQAIVNDLGVIESASIGVANKVCAFVMLVPSAFMQSMSSFVAQNAGARKFDRAQKALWCGIGVSFAMGVVMFSLAFFKGDMLASIFVKASEVDVIAAAADYLKAYAIDCLLTAILFSFIGFYNGLGMTRFLMIRGIAGAFLVRIPVSWMMSKRVPVSLFHIGLATPCSSVLEVLMCLGYLIYVKRKVLPKLAAPEN